MGQSMQKDGDLGCCIDRASKPRERRNLSGDSPDDDGSGKGFDRTLSLRCVFRQATVLRELDLQIDALFTQFDCSSTGLIHTGEEMASMIACLQGMRLAFGPIVPDRTPRTEEEYDSHDSSFSAFHRMKAKGAPRVIMKSCTDAIGEAGVQDGLDLHKFRIWMRKAVVTRRNNLRVLISKSDFVDDVLEFCFREADKDNNGMLSADELSVFLKNASQVLTEIMPNCDRLHRFMGKVKTNDSGDLSYHGFRPLIVEVLSLICFAHFRLKPLHVGLSRPHRSRRVSSSNQDGLQESPVATRPSMVARGLSKKNLEASHDVTRIGVTLTNADLTIPMKMALNAKTNEEIRTIERREGSYSGVSTLSETTAEGLSGASTPDASPPDRQTNTNESLAGNALQTACPATTPSWCASSSSQHVA